MHMMPAVIARLEAGNVKPSTRTLERLAAATGMRVRIFLRPGTHGLTSVWTVWYSASACPPNSKAIMIPSVKVRTLAIRTNKGRSSCLRDETLPVSHPVHLRAHWPHCDRGGGARHADRNDPRRHPKDTDADGRSDARLCDDKYRSGNRAGSDDCAAHAS